MENLFNTSSRFTLLAIEEMERFKYLYCTCLLVTYLLIVMFSSAIFIVVLINEALHQPMYILIANLMLNGIFGSSCFLPKLIVDLLLSSKVISRLECFIQSFCVTVFAYFEISAFTIMAYDTYLAVCHPLRYPTLMKNETALKLIGGSVVFNIVFVLVSVLLSAKLPLCGSHINNFFCDNMSIFILSCTDSSVNKLYGTIKFVIYLIVSLVIIAYSYMKVLAICFHISEDACRKAIHTLVTHSLNFSIFLVGALFIFIRYRLESVNLPLICHILLSLIGSTIPPLLNPVVYGIRTKALRVKVFSHIQKMNKKQFIMFQ
ncbi:hypothetical protein GDO86_020524 [Hymenochirus boettgeri]|uniref:G-protein coupled receptors family 1 profile domain-containing protein n=1 Tax=Hymenochirus boettgeri TaxID=247094 RepID=A0A8T2IMC7_9PIPI|nr:hypothetical protein GDO86_020524 [Hymenochirus boettgeri]